VPARANRNQKSQIGGDLGGGASALREPKFDVTVERFNRASGVVGVG
jgi:hypothetical protein